MFILAAECDYPMYVIDIIRLNLIYLFMQIY